MDYSVLTHQDKNFIIDHYYAPGLKRLAQHVVLRLMSPMYRVAARIWRKPQVDHKYKLAIVACFKDEGSFLREWIEYHLLMGFEHFYLYNNNSTDNYADVLRPYIESGVVTLIDFPQVPVQQAAYEDFYSRYRHEAQWVSFLDLDEYLCPLREPTMTDWIDCHGYYPIHMIYWQMFGTSGHMTHDYSRLTTEQYTVAWPKLDSIGKLLWNTDYDIAEFSRGMMHAFDVKAGPFRLPPMNQFGKIVKYDIHRGGSHRHIQCNHYWSRSLESFGQKLDRGDGAYEIPWKCYDKFLQHEHFNTSVNFGIYRFLVQLKQRMRSVP